MVDTIEVDRKLISHEWEGICPLCNGSRSMQPLDRNLICDYKRYYFPFKIYYCNRHGVYVWRGRRHELFDLNKRLNQVINIEDLEPVVIQRFSTSDSYMPTLSDYEPVKMKCPYCEGGPKKNGEWKQHHRYLTLATGNKTVFCPWCSAEIPIEKARA